MKPEILIVGPMYPLPRRDFKERPGLVPRLAMRALASFIGLGIALAVAASGSAAELTDAKELGGDECFAFGLRFSNQTAGSQPDGLVIRDETAFRKLFDPAVMRQSCAGRDPEQLVPKVDFTTNLVLGLWSAGTCADRGFRRTVQRDDARKTLTYTVVTLSGTRAACMGPGPESLNLVAAPQPPPGYEVMFRRGRE